jgi:hypothetical protein
MDESCGDLVATDCEGLPGVYSTIWCLCYKTNKLKKKKQEERRWACLHRLGKKGEPSWPAGAWSAGRLGYRVPPAAISRGALNTGCTIPGGTASVLGVMVSHITRNTGGAGLPQALPEASSGASPSHL